MQKKWIENYNELATTDNRKLALDIADAGYEAINTEKVILNSIKIENNILTILDKTFDLANFNKIKVVGFGKASCHAALALEKILGEKINEGVVIGLQKVTCDYIETFAGTHPRPTDINILPGKKIFDIVDKSEENDLVIAIVSGGGSALLCYPESECTQGGRLYDEFIKCGKTTIEMNAVRKHLSLIKGGGLAKIAYPATVIGLIFSDVPGDHFGDVASGPTYKDESTIEDVEKIIEENNLGVFDLIETPKEDKYFEKVHNFVLVSNQTAVLAMYRRSEELGLKAKIISTELYDEVSDSLKKIFDAKKSFDGEVILAAGEPNLEVKKKGGTGGRNLYMGVKAIQMDLIKQDDVFIPLASDGMDNSDAAGAIVDNSTIEKINKFKINVDQHLSDYNAYPVFKQSGDMIKTGPTGANVSDLMILLTNKSNK
jgi:glycerate-2-kinase